MSTATIEIQPRVSDVGFTDDDMLSVHLVDGRVVLVPLEWYPRLAHASDQERRDWRVFEDSDERDIVFWESLDELVPAIALLTGVPVASQRARSKDGWPIEKAARNKDMRRKNFTLSLLNDILYKCEFISIPVAFSALWMYSVKFASA
jgi:hypothetical protein